MKTESTEVLIVGAGPTGLALSIALHQRGVPHVLIDRLEQGQNTSRAGVIHAQTLEALRPLGVVEELTTLGVELRSFAIRDRDRTLLRLDFEQLPTAYPYVLMLPQNVTEAVLARRIAALGGSVRRGVTAESIEQDERGVRVTVSQGVERRVIEAAWVVGADGMHSVVRRAQGLEFAGQSYAESFILADVRLDRELSHDEVALLFSPEGMVVLAPLPGGVFRLVATLDEAPAEPTLADVQAVLDTRGPRARRVTVQEVLWSSRFRVHHRLATSYRRGRAILMGDAAHVHSPAGGQGMNTGLIDAVVLGELLAQVVKGERSEHELELYEQLRRPAAAQVLELSERLTRVATVRGRVQRMLRNVVLGVLGRLPWFRRRLALDLSGLSRAALAAVPAPAPRAEVSRRQLAARHAELVRHANQLGQ